MSEPAFQIRALTDEDRVWLADFNRAHWGDDLMISRGRSFYISTLPGFVAVSAVERVGQVLGLISYHIEGDACEITSLDSLVERRGVGSALIDAVKPAARAAGCARLWLITTNDNTDALRFYQKRGFVLAAIYRNALEQSRRLKPQIPLIGLHDIPLRDEIELEMVL